MNLRNLLPIITLLLGLGAGVVLTKATSPLSKTSQTEQSSTSAKSKSTSSGSSLNENEVQPLKNATASNTPSGTLELLINKLALSHQSFPPADFFAAIESMGTQDISHFVEQLETSFKNDSRSHQVRQALFRHWATIDPQGALAKAKKPNQLQSSFLSHGNSCRNHRSNRSCSSQITGL